ncbi:MAG: nucleotidyltransferase domain-containing protein [Candidatus Wallbacteria bacterium]|nr:nucleotidyltransferase domain-containing protein [Candidatus Wallbacteria bacterium]
MAQIPVEIENKIRRYLETLEQNRIRIKTAVLFGSYAKGTYDQWSDIDLAIVSDDFEGNRFNDVERLRPFKKEIDWSISPMPFTAADFDESNVFVREIIRSGVRIV